LSESTIGRIKRAPAENTRRAYGRWIADFEEWCEVHGRTFMPATAATLAEYVSALADAGKGPASIKQAIAAIRAEHAFRGFEEQPPLKYAKAALRTHTRERTDAGDRGKQATPIVIDALRRMIDTCDPDSLRGRRDRALLVIGWSGMLRRSELSALLDRDVRVTSDGLSVFIPRSKTDKDAHGETVAIPPGSHPETDPVRVIGRYRESLAGAGITGGRLFRSVGLGGRVGGEISGDAINDVVKEAAVRAQLPGAEGYSAHSLRAGGATAAYMAGVPVATIAKHGRWAPNSPVVLGYIRAVDRWRDNAMRNVGL
jgi:site-specific recombinase XerD